MDDRIRDYRKVHHRCRYCKYIRYSDVYYEDNGPIVASCMLKFKDMFTTKWPMWLANLRGVFCHWFEVGDNN